MGVTHRHADVAVTEVLLHLQDARSALSEVAGEGVAQDMPTDAPKVRLFAGVFQRPLAQIVGQQLALRQR